MKGVFRNSLEQPGAGSTREKRLVIGDKEPLTSDNINMSSKNMVISLHRFF